MRGLPFRISAHLYALRLADLSEVIPLATLRAVPGAAPAVAGLLNLHGRMVPVLDLARHCGGASEPVDLRTRIVLVEGGAGPWGLVLATTGAIVDVDPGTLQPCPVATAGVPFLAGMSPGPGGSLQWIDADALHATLRPLRPALEDARG